MRLKKGFLFFIFTTMMCLMLIPTNASAATTDLVGKKLTEIFPDPVLSEIVSDESFVPLNDPLTSADVNRLISTTKISIHVGLYPGIVKNLEGIQYLTNLTALDLPSQQIQDISLLENLTKLEQLTIDGNPISSFSPIKDLTNLKILWLDDTPLTDNDLSNLSNLKNLWALRLSYTNIHDLSALDGLPLEQLVTYGTHIADFSTFNRDKMTLLGAEKLTISQTAAFENNKIALATPFKDLFGNGMDVVDFLQMKDADGQLITDPQIIEAAKQSISYDKTSNRIDITYNPLMPKDGIIDISYSSKMTSGMNMDINGILSIIYSTIPPIENGSVNIEYVDEAGNELAKPDTMSGPIGSPYETTAKTIDGWTLKTTPSNAKGAFTSEVQQVIYVYTKEPAGGKEPVLPPTNQDGKQPPALNKPESTISDPGKVLKNKNNTKVTLPSTGENLFMKRLLPIVGVVLLIAAASYLYYLKKKSKSE